MRVQVRSRQCPQSLVAPTSALDTSALPHMLSASLRASLRVAVRTSLRARLLFPLLLSMTAASACSTETVVAPVPPPPAVNTELDGNWRAFYFVIEPTVGLPQDVISTGGSLNLSIYQSQVTGTLNIPAGVLGAAVRSDLTGSIDISRDSVRFQQPQETFIRRATWFRVDGRVLFLVAQPLGNVRYTVALIREL